MFATQNTWRNSSIEYMASRKVKLLKPDTGSISTQNQSQRLLFDHFQHFSISPSLYSETFSSVSQPVFRKKILSSSSVKYFISYLCEYELCQECLSTTTHRNKRQKVWPLLWHFLQHKNLNFSKTDPQPRIGGGSVYTRYVKLKSTSGPLAHL